MVSEKLDYLMTLTQTRNSTLGKALSFDPSYIGRIRTGKRGIPKHQPFLEPAALFFAKNLREGLRQRAAAEAICPGHPWPEDPEAAARLILQWLCVQDEFPTPFAGTQPEGLPAPERGAAPAGQPGSACYFGRRGKRDAVDAFLTPLALSGEPQTLLLYSDEDFSWMYEDPVFTRRWLSLMLELVRSGSRIRIIHTVARGIGEMLEAVQKWMPLYTTGAVEPYYYPRLRDGIYHRTLFIAHGQAAVISDSVAGNDEGKLNLLLRDPGAVAALEEEFRDYLSLCRPLMQVFTARNAEQYAHFTAGLSAAAGDLIFAGALPGDCALAGQALAGGYSVTQLLHLPEPEAVRAGLVSLPMNGLSRTGTVCTVQHMAERLREVLTLLREQPRYRAVLTEQAPTDILLYVREGAGTVFCRSAPPATVFCMTEPNMTASFWEYLSRLAIDTRRREQTVEELERYLCRLEAPNP